MAYQPGTRRLFLEAIGASSLLSVPGVNGRRDDVRSAGQGRTAEVSFERQVSDGQTVVVDRVFVPDGGFANIHDTLEWLQGEGPDSVVGTSEYLHRGMNTHVEVALDDGALHPTSALEELFDAKMLVAMAHRDTNDNQEYDFPEADGPYFRNGVPVIDVDFVSTE